MYHTIVEQLTVRNDDDDKFDKNTMHNKLPQDEQERYDVCESPPVCTWQVQKIRKGAYMPVACDRFSWGGMYLKKLEKKENVCF